MSKESYARGFCKAAEAAGVDPVALAKYAQQYKTDGWAPAQVRPFKKTIPNYNPIAARNDVVVGNSAISALSPTRIQQALTKLVSKWPSPSEEYSDLSDARSEVDPRYKNWLNAHKKALFDAIDESGIRYYDQDENPLDEEARKKLVQSASEAYHKSMFNSTNASPATVVAPANPAVPVKK